MAEVKETKVDQLILDDHNFNKGTEFGQHLMEKSFRRFGAGRSILLDKNNRVIAGNKSLQTAAEIGLDNVLVVETTGEQIVAVKRTDIDLDSKEGREMALADNATSKANLEFDLPEIDSIAREMDFNPADWGVDFSDIDLDIMKEEGKETQEDDFDENEDAVEARCQTGDIWRLGDHRLMCGDSTKEEDVARLMDGELADLWLTDPPYNVAVKNSQGMTIQNDNMKSDDFGQFLLSAFRASEAVMRAGAAFYVWFASCEHINFEKALNSVGLKVRQELVWNKNHFVLGRQDYQWKHEPCLYGWKDGAAHYFVDVRNNSSVIPDFDELDFEKMKKEEMKELLMRIYDAGVPTTVMDENKPTKDADHPTMKPVRLFGYQMYNSTRRGEIVLDTFGGSGTTIVAAEQLQRKARTMELDPHYCDVILARWEKLTGLQAELINRE